MLRICGEAERPSVSAMAGALANAGMGRDLGHPRQSAAMGPGFVHGDAAQPLQPGDVDDRARLGDPAFRKVQQRGARHPTGGLVRDDRRHDRTSRWLDTGQGVVIGGALRLLDEGRRQGAGHGSCVFDRGEAGAKVHRGCPRGRKDVQIGKNNFVNLEQSLLLRFCRPA